MIPDQFAENKLVNELKQRIRDVDYRIGDAEVRRFLRGRNADIDKAEEMLRKSIEWRKESKFDEALNWKIDEQILEEFPVSCDGKDKDGRAVIYASPGRWGIRKFIMKGWKNEMERNIHVQIANVMKAAEDSGFEQFRVIIDLEDLSYWKVAHYETMQMALHLMRIYEQNFPERLCSAIFINAPWAFYSVFPVLKSIMTGTTLSKIQIFDSNPDKYFPAILDIIPASDLPTEFKSNNPNLIDSCAVSKNNNNN